jgi:uncharacterized protein
MIVNLHVTGDCNLRCDYCYASPKTSATMNLETARLAVELASRHADDVSVIFIGGEPLLRRDLMTQLVAECEAGQLGQARFHHQVVTNGTLIDEPFVRWAAHHQVSISVSLDGTVEAQDRHRRFANGGGTWRTVVERIPLLVAHNPYLHAQIVVSPDTAPQLAESVAFVFGLGIRFVSTAIDHRAAWDGASFNRLEGAYKQVARLYEQKTLRGDRFFLSCMDARIRTHVRGPCTEQERCSAGIHQFSVGPSGRIYPCVQFVGDDLPSDQVIGHVATGFDEEARQRFHLESEGDKAQCEGCALRGRCSSWCACVNWSTTRSVGRVSPVLCEHERLLMPIADGAAARLFKKRNALFIHKHYNAAFPIMSVAEDILESIER